MLFTARGCGGLLIMPRPLSGCQIKAEIKGFLLMYHLFLYYQWFSQNIEKGWRKIFEKRLFPRYLKMTKIIKNISSSGFPFSERTITSTETNDTSAKSPWFKLSFGTLKVGGASSEGRHAHSPRKGYCWILWPRGGFLTSITFLAVNFKDTSFFKLSN